MEPVGGFAPREPAVLVPPADLLGQPGGDVAGPVPDTDGLTVGTVDGEAETAVAEQPLEGRGGDDRPIPRSDCPRPARRPRTIPTRATQTAATQTAAVEVGAVETVRVRVGIAVSIGVKVGRVGGGRSEGRQGDVDDHLGPLRAGRISARAHLHQSIRAASIERVPLPTDPAPTLPVVAVGFRHSRQQIGHRQPVRALQPPMQMDRPVIVIAPPQMPAGMTIPVRPSRHRPRRPARRLQLRNRMPLPQPHQLRILHPRQTRQRHQQPHMGHAQPSVRQRRPQLREPPQSPSHPSLKKRRAFPLTRPDRDPLPQRPHPITYKHAAPIDLRLQHQPVPPRPSATRQRSVIAHRQLVIRPPRQRPTTTSVVPNCPAIDVVIHTSNTTKGV